jgi:hypothetical protein
VAFSTHAITCHPHRGTSPPSVASIWWRSGGGHQPPFWVEARGREGRGSNRVRVTEPRVFYTSSGARASEWIEPANLLLGWAAQWVVLSRAML